MENSSEITVLLREWGQNRAVDTTELFRFLYPQLHEIAAALMKHERPGHLLQPTSVVHELFLKLVQQRKLDFENRQHFYGFAARLMRRILVDHARTMGRQKRDAGKLVELTGDVFWTDASPETILDVDRALSELSALDERKCRIVEMRLMLGFTSEETAELLSLSKASVDRDLRFSRGWLQLRLARQPVKNDATVTTDEASEMNFEHP